MRRFALPALLFTALCAAPALAADTDATTRPAEDAAALCARCIDEAMAGEFEEAYRLAGRAHHLEPENETAARAEKLLERYLEQRADAEAHRRREYTQAVERVRRCLMAQDRIGELEDAEAAKPARENLSQAFELYAQATAAVETARTTLEEAFEAAEGDAGDAQEQAEARLIEARRTRDETIQAAEEMLERVASAREAVAANMDGAYAETFDELCDAAVGKIEGLRTAWSEMPETRAGLWEWSELLAALDDELAQALADLDNLVDESPWQAAVMHASLARRLSNGTDYKATDWYRRVVGRVEEIGRKSMDDAEWYDALSAYAGLEELDPDKEEYQDKVRIVRRHVRVLGLYGPEDESDAPEGAELEEGPAWRETVAGVDAEMVKSAISQLDMYYVTTVEYREVATAALEAMRVLAETPQAAETFEGLADDAKRREFLAAVRRQMDTISKRARVDHVDVLLAFNAVLRASEKSVNVPPEVLSVEFTDGLLSALDKFTSMIWPSDLDDFVKKTMGHFTGVGVQISKEEGEPLEVVTPLADSPALQAGIRTGDLIVAVDGTPTRKLSINKLVSMIMGEEGTKVVLTIERRGHPAPFDVPVIRDRIEIRTVKGWRRQRGGDWRYLVDSEGTVGYVRLEQFTRKTPEELREALTELAVQVRDGDGGELRSLVIDLRFNPGGLLPSATDVANEFLNHGRIVATKGRQRRPNAVDASSKGAYLTGDLVVLVNDNSASAAEIVSGAIKDWERGVIIGERTYGKGSVQNVIPLRHERARLKLTTAYYYLPSGRLLHRKNGQKDWGVDPDIEVNITPKQTKRWLELRRRTGLLLLDREADHLEEDLREQYDRDIQLQTAVLVLKLLQLRAGEDAA